MATPNYFYNCIFTTCPKLGEVTQQIEITNLSLQNKTALDEIIKKDELLRNAEKTIGDKTNQISQISKECTYLKYKLDSISHIDKQNPLYFIPDGYKLFDKILGDLNNDGAEDCVLIIQETKKDNLEKNENDEIINHNRRGLIALFQVNNGYDLKLSNYNCFSSDQENGGSYYAPELYVEIQKNNLNIAFIHGRYGIYTYTFRYEKTDFELIKYNSFSNNGPVTQSHTEVDFLNGYITTRENTNTSAEGGDEVFEEDIKRIQTTRPLKLSEIKDFDQLEINRLF